jgi:tRNA1Val (adenine37-N6)-methyltransferase
MKVCTDACLFGAWVADKLEKKEIVTKKIFDIGCGTGLLSLMLAQKTYAKIDAIEIDADAFLQATENIENSPMKNKINIFHGPIHQFFAHEKYDFIICNPPFYENQLKSDDESKNAAMHSTTLTFTELANALRNSLAANGIAAVLIPHNRVNDFKEALSNVQLFIKEQLNVSHAPNKKTFRSCLLISGNADIIVEKSISIKNNINEYSTEFIELLKDYYLNF